MNKDAERRLDAAELWFLRRMLRISKTVGKSKTHEMEMATYKRSLLDVIRERRGANEILCTHLQEERDR